MQLKIAFFISLVFFIIGVATLPHYGINWDTINHLPRGQAYLHYFLTGKKDYSDLPLWKSYWQKPESLFIDSDVPKDQVPKRSLYENDATTFDWFLPYDGYGHPPLSDIFSAGFNILLFQKLRLINDIDSYRVYGIFLASALVGLIYWWTSKVYGNFAGLVAALALGLYPLFWSESHFNTEKDVPEAAFWAFMLFSVWKGITGKSWKWIILAGVFFGFALGTKFNILFSAFVVLPWVAALCLSGFLKKENLSILVSGLVVILLGFLIFVGTWPYLWQDIVSGLQRVVIFYKDIGLTQSADSRFVGPFGINTYPLQWILYTTPPLVLLFFAFGLSSLWGRLRKEGDKVSLLFILWLAVPIARVIWPGTTVYGGVRQIMEFLPAMAIIAGLGAQTLIQKFKTFNFYFLIFIFAALFWPIYKLHPNENIYFNSFVGGLAGAKEKNIPAWGNSFGAAYRQGVTWINKNAEKDASLVLAFELMPNIPNVWFRPDIIFHNSRRSGFLKNGEYAITLTYEGTKNRSYYDTYLEEFLNPVFETKVDDVAILKVWKNSVGNTRKDYTRVSSVKPIKLTLGKEIEALLDRELSLSHIEISYSEKNCPSLSEGVVSIYSQSDGWSRSKEVLPTGAVSILGTQPREGRLLFPFLGEKARTIKIDFSPENSCLVNVREFIVYYFPKRS